MKATKYILIALTCFIVGISAETQQNERWNATPNDINNLLKGVKNRIDADYSMAIKDMSELNPDPEQNPVVYYSSHYNYSFTDEQRKKLRKFMLDGGMMIFNTGLGSTPFYRSTVRELGLIFPEVPLQRLSSDHPLFHSYYDVDRVKYSPGVYKTGFKGNEPWIDGITINCRTVAIVSRFCLAVAWDGGEVRPEYAAYMPESAQKLGVNIFAYATAQRAWAKDAANQMKFVDKEESVTDKMFIAQVVYDGEWKTRHAGMSVLLQTFNNKTEIPVKLELKELKLSDPRIFDIPLLYITGHENFKLDKVEMVKLRQYLMNGGFLFAEACCGRKGFDLAFRQAMTVLLPEYQMSEIPADSIILKAPNEMKELAVTPALAAHLKSSTIRPFLYGIDINGHYAVIYSPFGMAGGWEMSPNPYAHGYDPSGSINLGQNILMYAVTQ